MTCGPTSSSTSAMPRPCWSGRDRLREEGHAFGRRAAAVFRHGRVGIENCQIGVFLAYASQQGPRADRPGALPARALGRRSAAAGEGRGAGRGRVRHQAQARAAMLQRALAAGVPFAWVTSDSVYGSDHRLRRLIERHGRGYVLAVTSAQRLGLKPVADWLEDVPARGWRRLSAGDGAKGPRLYDWAYLPYRSLAAAGWKSGLLIRRSLKEPDKLAFYLTLAPNGRLETGAGGGDTLGDRGVLRGRQRRGRAGSVRGPFLGRLAPPRHARHARARLSRRSAPCRSRGENRNRVLQPDFGGSSSFPMAPRARCWWRRRQRDQAHRGFAIRRPGPDQMPSRRRTSGTVNGSRSALRSTMPCFPARGAAKHGKTGVGQHRQRDVTMPAGPGTHLVLVQPDLAFCGFKRRLNGPSCARHPNQIG